MKRHSWFALALLAGSQALPAAAIETTFIAEGLHDPMEIAVAPNDDLLVAEREGRVLRVRPSTGGVFEIGTIDVTALRPTDPNSPTAREDGLLGIALDPQFAANQRIFLYYSAADKMANRLSRFTLKNGVIDKASEKMLFEIPTQRRDKVCHQAGSLAFGPDGLLYLSTGDNTNPFESGGYAPIDDREGREHCDAMRSAGNTNDLRGKILRIKPTENGYDIPPGNLFRPGTEKTRPEIYVMGCRNPFRISIDSKTSAVYWGEVGPDAGGENNHGPRGYDEVNQALSAGNHGWPFVIADNKPYPIFDFATGKPGEMTNPQAPINPGHRNTGLRELPPARPALIWYPYADSKEFPAMGSGGRNAMAGPVFYFDPNRKWNILDRADDHTLITYDWMRGRMWKAKLGEGEKLESLTPLMDKLMHPMDMEMAKDGTLYLLEYGGDWYFNKNGRIRRLRPADGNHAPTLKIEAVAGAPRAFEVKNAADADGDQFTIDWWLTEGATERKLGSGNKIEVPADTGLELRAVATDARGAVGVAHVSLVKEVAQPALKLALTGNPASTTFGQALAFDVSADALKDAAKLVVRARYIAPTGHDAGGPDFAPKIRDLATARACFACHQVDAASVGPKYVDVAFKYRGNADALSVLKNKLKTGGAGVWGVVPMPPQAAVSPEEADQLVGAVLGLVDSMAETRGARTGTLTLPSSPGGIAPGGAWEIWAEAPGFTTAKMRLPDR